jgi:Smg protein
MKENVFDVLMYLFEYYFQDDEIQPDRASLESDLFQAGFTSREVNKAFDWLDGLAESRQRANLSLDKTRSLRVFIEPETARLDADCRGFILFLEQAGILTPSSRELVIDRVMALEADEEVDLDTLKWVILMVLFNQPGEEEAYACMENLLFDGAVQLLH